MWVQVELIYDSVLMQWRGLVYKHCSYNPEAKSITSVNWCSYIIW